MFQQVRDFFTSRKTAYQFTFNDGVHAQRVLADLAKFCRAHKTTFHKNERAAAVMQGRREVWLRIEEYLNLTPEELWEIYRKDSK